MKRDMKKWLCDLRDAPGEEGAAGALLPLDPADGDQRAGAHLGQRDPQQGMKLVADRTDAAASVSMMDLSVEAECFGSQIHVEDGEVPTVVGSVVSSEAEAEALPVPPGRRGTHRDLY